MDALYDGPRFFRPGASRHGRAHDQQTVVSLKLTSNLSCQTPVAGIDVARFQRTSKRPIFFFFFFFFF